MKPSLNKLYKFLKLEIEQNYTNRAVIGGLEKILAAWEVEARGDGLPEDAVREVGICLREYNSLQPAQRPVSLDALWQRLRGLTGEHLPALPAPPIEQKPVDTPLPPPRSSRRETPPRPPRDERRSQGGERARSFTPAAPAAAALAPIPDGPPAALDASVTVLSGVGPKHGETLGRLGLKTLGDMLYFFPRRYDDYSQLKPINRLWYGEEVTVIGVLQSVNTRILRGGHARMTEAIVSDGTAAMRLTFWNPYVAKRLRPGLEVVLSGKVEQYLGRLVMVNPEVELLEHENLSTNRIVPVYPLTANITQRWLRKQMHTVVNYWALRVHDPLPDRLRADAALMPLPTALLQAHFPDSFERLKAARYRLAFDEIFLLQLGVQRQKRAWQDRTARAFETPDDWFDGLVARLPFPLTGAQQRALADVRGDLASARPMNRLLQGDVGSGKTVVAALALAMIFRHGSQTAIVAPTGILAEQHYKNLSQLLVGEEGALLRPEQIRLLVGATPQAERNEILAALAGGDVKILVGTHALLEEPVTFADLQLAVIDEQHRFGVQQRAALRGKGENPHLLVMTATPIPRSLALTVYGDLDLSVIDEMPPGRQEIETQVFYPRERERAYQLIRSQIEQGHQAFIIYPLVEETQKAESGEETQNDAGRAAVDEHARLQREIFPKYRLGLLHGRLRPEEKDAVMADFRDGKTQVLVSTSVVEVGVDVPNATVMLVEGANRFGLSQLHQFRGRVGRGQAKSYCVLIPENPDDTENERLQAMAASNDGFVLAEKDLEQRGPGDFLGTRQAGFTELRLASLTDVRLIEAARKQAQAIFHLDPDLALPEHAQLLAALERFWHDGKGDIS
ncbi:MAG: ATP-dependent DNA helicase RecG [Chloroflexota bacterium]